MTCDKLHTMAQNGKRFTFDRCDILQFVPWNGIYLLFEKNETGHAKDRIVRVGINREDYNLPERLVQHFINPNKDKSIFRKNIGRSFLNGDVDYKHYLDVWNNGGKRDYSIEIELEIKISQYIQDNISFVVIRVENREYRSVLEKRIIATINRCEDCKPSLEWLGNQSPDSKITKSGLWQVQGLNGTLLTEKDIDFIGEMMV